MKTKQKLSKRQGSSEQLKTQEDSVSGRVRATTNYQNKNEGNAYQKLLIQELKTINKTQEEKILYQTEKLLSIQDQNSNFSKRIIEMEQEKLKNFRQKIEYDRLLDFLKSEKVKESFKILSKKYDAIHQDQINLMNHCKVLNNDVKYFKDNNILQEKQLENYRQKENFENKNLLKTIKVLQKKTEEQEEVISKQNNLLANSETKLMEYIKKNEEMTIFFNQQEALNLIKDKKIEYLKQFSIETNKKLQDIQIKLRVLENEKRKTCIDLLQTYDYQEQQDIFLRELEQRLEMITKQRTKELKKTSQFNGEDNDIEQLDQLITLSVSPKKSIKEVTESNQSNKKQSMVESQRQNTFVQEVSKRSKTQKLKEQNTLNINSFKKDETKPLNPLKQSQVLKQEEQLISPSKMDNDAQAFLKDKRNVSELYKQSPLDTNKVNQFLNSIKRSNNIAEKIEFQ